VFLFQGFVRVFHIDLHHECLFGLGMLFLSALQAEDGQRALFAHHCVKPNAWPGSAEKKFDAGTWTSHVLKSRT